MQSPRYTAPSVPSGQGDLVWMLGSRTLQNVEPWMADKLIAEGKAKRANTHFWRKDSVRWPLGEVVMNQDPDWVEVQVTSADQVTL